MSDQAPTQSIVTKEEKALEYIPYGCQDKIKLSVAIIKNLIAVPTKSGKTCSDRDAMKFLMLCHGKRLNPFEGDAYLIGYDGRDGIAQFSLITAHQAFLKRAELHPEYDGMKSGLIVQNEDGRLIDLEGDFHLDDQKVVGGWATVYFVKRKVPTTRRLRLSRFKKPFGVWLDDPAGMIVKCFDEQTEVLTAFGFENFATAEGKILQVTDRGLEPTDAVPFCQAYNGPMVEFESRNGGFAVTPNHDLPLAVNGAEEQRTEARHLLDIKQRDRIAMPMATRFERADFPIEDKWLILAAAYLSDGSDNSASAGFSIAVSRERKVNALRALKLHRSESQKKDAGRIATGLSGREITTLADKQAFYYSRSKELDWLISRGKVANVSNILALSQRQAKLFVDSWLLFDGQKLKTCKVGRIFTSRTDHCALLEVAATLAGYPISDRKQRTSDLSHRNGYFFTLGGSQSASISKALIRSVPNHGGKVWCVTVPSGKIVVRRNGFSAISHNCAEADALRSSFPTMLGGLYLREEVELPTNGHGASDITSGAAALPAAIAGSSQTATEAKAELAGATTAAATATPSQLSSDPVQNLAGYVTAERFTFEQFRTWGIQTGNLDETVQSFEDVPPAVATRLLRAKSGLLKGLQAVREGQSND